MASRASLKRRASRRERNRKKEKEKGLLWVLYCGSGRVGMFSPLASDILVKCEIRLQVRARELNNLKKRV